jgi:phosphopantothenoylcysteine decarboxylase
MNTLMWAHPFTERQLNIMRQLNVTIIEPVVKMLACGDHGEIMI